MSDVIDNDNRLKLFIIALASREEDSGFTEDLAKYFVGSWLQVVKAYKDDDSDWFEETREFMIDALNYLESE